jgi:hypothetical protein
VPDDYGSHSDFMSWVENSAPQRQESVKTSLRRAFEEYIEVQQTEFILFGRITAADLASILEAHPEVLKPLILLCNIAGRAISRDLGIRNLNTYKPKLDTIQAAAVAGYIKPFLPPAVAIEALTELDRVQWIDKEIRRLKGHWEDLVTRALTARSGRRFKKRKFVANEEEFEIDSASPVKGTIEIAVDVKRIEARRDIHKRTDEILNKAAHFKEFNPSGLFGAVIYYPFVDEHVNIERRMTSDHVDGLVFAGQSAESIDSAVSLLIGQLGLPLVADS